MSVYNSCSAWWWWGVLDASPAAQREQLLHSARPAAFTPAQCRAAPEMWITLDQAGPERAPEWNCCKGSGKTM